MNDLTSIHKQAGVTLIEKNGIEVPAVISGLKEEYDALRNRVIMADYSHYTKVIVRGSEAFDFLDYAVAGDVAEIRDEQALYTVMLNENGEILCDLYILNDDDTYLLLTEFADDATFVEALNSRLGEFDAEIKSITRSHNIVVFEGPYAWELATEIYGLDVIGIPYLGFIALENDTYLFRGGKSGEFSYKVILPGSHAAKLWRQGEELGQKYELVKTGIDLHNISRLENPYWHPEKVGRYSHTPRELQLQWMVRYDKEEFVGREALLQSKELPLKHKVVGLREQEEGDCQSFVVGDLVMCGDQEIGTIANAGYSPTLNRTIAQAFLDASFAYAGMEGYRVKSRAGKGAEVAVKTCATPFFLNKSMLVNPNEHSFVDPKKYKNLVEQLEKEGVKQAEAG